MICDQLPGDLDARESIVVVGAGPVGISLACRLSAFGKHVILLEGGAAVPRERAMSWAEFDNATPRFHDVASAVSRQGFGGTSAIWGGRCMPLDPFDLTHRPYVPHTTSRLKYSHMAAYHSAASEYFGFGQDVFDASEHGDSGDPALPGQIVRVAPCDVPVDRFRQSIADSKALLLCLNTRVLALEFDPSSQEIVGLVLESGGRRVTIRPLATVLCCGGIQTARLLLLVQRKWPAFLGGTAGGLGRYYMGHLAGSVARIRFRDARAALPFLVTVNSNGDFEFGCISLSDRTKRDNALLNAHFAPVNFPLSDPGYLNGALSALHLGLALYHRDREYMQHYRPGHRPTAYDFDLNVPAHFRNIFLRPRSTVSGLLAIGAWMRVRRQSSGFQVRNENGIYALSYHAEHAPDPESRVTLSDRRDGSGVPLPRVDLRFGNIDVESVVRSHEILARWLDEVGIATLEWLQPPEHRVDHVWSQTHDGYHQIGLTRISHGPATGVVDENLKVHGVNNLFIAGCSVLPASGKANPTFPAVALAMRLADRLSQHRSAFARSGLVTPEPVQPTG